jgi:hypothetical protein
MVRPIPGKPATTRNCSRIPINGSNKTWIIGANIAASNKKSANREITVGQFLNQ